MSDAPIITLAVADIKPGDLLTRLVIPFTSIEVLTIYDDSGMVVVKENNEPFRFSKDEFVRQEFIFFDALKHANYQRENQTV